MGYLVTTKPHSTWTRTDTMACWTLLATQLCTWVEVLPEREVHSLKMEINGSKQTDSYWLAGKIMNTLSCVLFLHAILSLHILCTSSGCPQSECKFWNPGSRLTPTKQHLDFWQLVFLSLQSASQGCANLDNYQRMLMAGVLFDQILENQVLTSIIGE